MKNNYLVSIIFFVFSLLSTAQSVTTSMVKGVNSSYCGEESYSFNFDDSYFKKIDNYDRTSISGPSRKESSGYDEKGLYYELRSPAWFLTANGVGPYQRVEHFAHKVFFNKRGGSILAVLEVDMDRGVEAGKFYISEAAKEMFCK